MDMIVAGYDFKFKMGWPRAYEGSASSATHHHTHHAKSAASAGSDAQ